MPGVNITKVYLLDVPLENDYKNTLYFASKQAQQTYFESRIQKSYTDFSYQRKDHKIRIPAHIDTLYGCNYVMYQNTYYSNKWFYAFITKMEYIDDGRTDITIETDCIQTWYFDFTVKASFIEREHVDDDTIGLHTVPESLEHGEYVCNQSLDVDMGDIYIVVGTTMAYETKVKGGLYGGCYSGIYYMYWSIDEYQSVNHFLNYMDENGHGDAVVSIFMLPEFVVEDLLDEDHHLANGTTIASQTEKLVIKHIPYNQNHPTLDGYTPKNKKLFTREFNYLLVTNNTGNAAIYSYELFNTPREGYEHDCLFDLFGVVCPGGSIKLVPKYYKGIERNFEESLNAGKFPVCSWSTDVYINWLTQNSVNIELQNLGNAMQIGAGALGVMSGNLLAGAGVIHGSMGIAQTMAEKYQHSLVPPQARGNINAGDVLRGTNKNTFSFLKMSIKSEYAQIIDGYFDMFGYKVNMVKVPNKNHRQRWWYTKTIDVNIDGGVPNDDMQIIKNAYNNGITFWRNASEIQNYSLSNNIV